MKQQQQQKAHIKQEDRCLNDDNMMFVYTQHVVFYLRRWPQAWLHYTFAPERADSLSSKLFPLLFILAENYFFSM